ncbi:MAG: glycine cleavage system aminomethyltransferase GcvT [Candidatus Schekmanbacteria bacterium]|nr:glycine cleavage system aminomethyltransferase GcvT [Candidatus Schekmanbacteria bacterium]
MDPILRRTPLYDEHIRRGARMVPFAGYEMPVLYTSVVEEHMAVRSAAGVFDVSHMGEIEVTGATAAAEIQHLVTNDISTLEPGRAQYNCLLDEDGGIIDDLLVYFKAPEHYLLVVNAATKDSDLAWIRQQCPRATICDISDETALLAVQGPAATAVLAPLTRARLDTIKYYRFVETDALDVPCLLSRTGYTGEDGFELYLPADAAVAVFRHLVEDAQPRVLPAGLGARDTLRLEAGMLLSGTDIDRTTSPLEAGLEPFVKLGKESFIGKSALIRQQAAGVRRRLVGLETVGRGIARHGYPVLHGAAQVGTVTSGTHAPTLGIAISLAYVPAELAAEGTALDIEIRGRPIAARVCKRPFYKRSKN